MVASFSSMGFEAQVMRHQGNPRIFDSYDAINKEGYFLQGLSLDVDGILDLMHFLGFPS